VGRTATLSPPFLLANQTANTRPTVPYGYTELPVPGLQIRRLLELVAGPRPTGQDGGHKQLHWDVDQKHCLQRGSGRLPRRLCDDDCRNHNTKLDLLRKRDKSWHIYTLHVRATSAVLEYKLPFLPLRLNKFSALRGVPAILRLSGQRQILLQHVAVCRFFDDLCGRD
jgi:hypothetical protein